MTGPVVVGVDGSESALRAVAWAAAEAARRHTALRLVAAFSWQPDDAMVRYVVGDEYRQDLEARERAKLDAAVAAAGNGVEVITELVAGAPVDVLAEESRAAQMLVLGHRGLGGFAELLLGSVAVTLAAKGACPVVVVRGGENEAGPVVVGVDGSPTSEAAVAFAFAAADLRRAPLTAVHLWWDQRGEPTEARLTDWKAYEENERELLGERLAGYGGQYPDVRVGHVVAAGKPAHALVEQSRTAQLVVVGSRGRGNAAGLLLGSVSHALLHGSACPIAIVRAAP